MKYVKKPIPVEAVKWDGANLYDITHIARGAKTPLTYEQYRGEPPIIYVKTLEGTMELTVGDYLIRGVRDELYPCRGDIFEETYDEVRYCIEDNCPNVATTTRQLNADTDEWVCGDHDRSHPDHRTSMIYEEDMR